MLSTPHPTQPHLLWFIPALHEIQNKQEIDVNDDEDIIWIFDYFYSQNFYVQYNINGKKILWTLQYT